MRASDDMAGDNSFTGSKIKNNHDRKAGYAWKSAFITVF
jgi:hypothetical protein